MLAWNANSKRRSRQGNNSNNLKRGRTSTTNLPRIRSLSPFKQQQQISSRPSPNNRSREGGIFGGGIIKDSGTSFVFPHRRESGISRDIHSLRRYATSSRALQPPESSHQKDGSHEAEKMENLLQEFPTKLSCNDDSVFLHTHQGRRGNNMQSSPASPPNKYHQTRGLSPNNISDSYGSISKKMPQKSNDTHIAMNFRTKPLASSSSSLEFQEEPSFHGHHQETRYSFLEKKNYYDNNDICHKMVDYNSNGGDLKGNGLSLPAFFRQETKYSTPRHQASPPSPQQPSYTTMVPSAGGGGGGSSFFGKYNQNSFHYSSSIPSLGEQVLSSPYSTPFSQRSESSSKKSRYQHQLLPPLSPNSPPRLNYSPPTYSPQKTYQGGTHEHTRLELTEEVGNYRNFSHHKPNTFQEDDQEGKFSPPPSHTTTRRSLPFDDSGNNHLQEDNIGFEFRGNEYYSSSQIPFEQQQHSTQTYEQCQSPVVQSKRKKAEEEEEEEEEEWGSTYDLQPENKKNVSDETAIDFAVSSWGLFENMTRQQHKQQRGVSSQHLVSPKSQRAERISRFLNLEEEEEEVVELEEKEIQLKKRASNHSQENNCLLKAADIFPQQTDMTQQQQDFSEQPGPSSNDEHEMSKPLQLQELSVQYQKNGSQLRENDGGDNLNEGYHGLVPSAKGTPLFKLPNFAEIRNNIVSNPVLEKPKSDIDEEKTQQEDDDDVLADINIAAAASPVFLDKAKERTEGGDLKKEQESMTEMSEPALLETTDSLAVKEPLHPISSTDNKNEFVQAPQQGEELGKSTVIIVASPASSSNSNNNDVDDAKLNEGLPADNNKLLSIAASAQETPIIIMDAAPIEPSHHHQKENTTIFSLPIPKDMQQQHHHLSTSNRPPPVSEEGLSTMRRALEAEQGLTTWLSVVNFCLMLGHLEQ